MRFKDYIQRHSATCYFITTFIISWLGAFILVASKLFNNEPINKTDGILMFPIMLIGPSAASIILTGFVEGKTGLRNLMSRIVKWKVPVKWYFLAFLIPPCLIMIVLLFLMNTVSNEFAPNFFFLGLVFGIPAGFFEEIGWTGYAFPKMRLKMSFMQTSIILGFIWGLWHLPVIDFLGAASPHGRYLLPFGLAFIVAMAAMRVIISWIYSNTLSVLLAQLTHAVSTGSLVFFGPNALSSGKETLWYSLYAILLWFAVLIISRLKIKRNTNAQQKAWQ
ncbi:CAAX prenyl protease-like protein [Thermoflavifilum aggregans]|uniref:CAAX prenyl protease-like protein n=2 Tax=Thermoflavifilum aggregans TaxID=454188 RepID=A0A2M9CSL4_9BACT|nr:CAAX prenyl protease-like protein [Thermoflavifilum aggregans]